MHPGAILSARVLLKKKGIGCQSGLLYDPVFISLFRPPINNLFTHIGKGIPGRLGFQRSYVSLIFRDTNFWALFYPFSDTAGVTGNGGSVGDIFVCTLQSWDKDDCQEWYEHLQS